MYFLERIAEEKHMRSPKAVFPITLPSSLGKGKPPCIRMKVRR